MMIVQLAIPLSLALALAITLALIIKKPATLVGVSAPAWSNRAERLLSLLIHIGFLSQSGASG